MNFLTNLLLEIGSQLVINYIRSSSTKKDDLVLDLAKESVRYLAKKSNNTVNPTISNELSVQQMRDF